MNGYIDLPALWPVMDTILSYLSVKERVICKCVCRSWRAEIELREQMNDTLVLHLGPYPWNLHWSETNNRGLMKFENSFEMRQSTILEHPLTRSLLEKIKKLAIVDFHTGILNPKVSSIQPYLGYFEQAEEIEIRGLLLKEEMLAIDLPKLKVLVIRDSQVRKLVLNCPSLEVLFWNRASREIDFQNVKKLKRLICFDWSTVSVNGKLENLEYLNLFTERDERVNDRLLDLMPNLRRFVIYSSDPQADLEIIREQQKRFGLENLEILFSGFRDPIEMPLNHLNGIVRLDVQVDQLLENYSKLVENSQWLVSIDYSRLFSKFKILPSDFVDRFSRPFSIQITEVTSYTHLFGFLKCYPVVENLIIHWSKVEADRILNMVHWLQPSLNELTIVEERPEDVHKIDLSFMRFLSMLAVLHLHSTYIPIEFLRKVATRRGTHFIALVFNEITTHYWMVIRFVSEGVVLYDPSIDPSIESEKVTFPSVEQLIAYAQTDSYLNSFFLM